MPYHYGLMREMDIIRLEAEEYTRSLLEEFAIAMMGNRMDYMQQQEQDNGETQSQVFGQIYGQER